MFLSFFVVWFCTLFFLISSLIFDFFCFFLHAVLPISQLTVHCLCLTVWQKLAHCILPDIPCQGDADDRSTFCHAVSLLDRSEEHTSELQSHFDLLCHLLLEKKKI